MLPPSRKSPRKIPPSARASPKTLLLSMASSELSWVLRRSNRRERGASGDEYGIGGESTQNRAAEGDDSLDDLVGGFAHNNFFTGQQGQNGVWSILDALDEVGVEYECVVI